MPVPETSMNEGSNPVLWKNKIRSPAFGLDVKPIAEPARARGATQQPLGPGEGARLRGKLVVTEIS